MRTSHSGRAVTARSPQSLVSSLPTAREYGEPSGPMAIVIAEPAIVELPEEPSVATAGDMPLEEREEAAEQAAADLHARITERAFHLYLSRNGEPGDALSDWLQAESEIKQETSQATD